MKGGCLVLLLTWIGVGFYNYQLLEGTDFAEYWWCAVLLGLGAALFISNFGGLIMTIRQFLVMGKPIQEWVDGSLAGISGKIQPVRGSIMSPFSGVPAVLYEYEVRSITGSGKNRSSTIEYQGMGMAPCTVRSIRLVGFPILSGLPISEKVTPERVAAHLDSAEFKELPSNPLVALNELSKVLNDDDGDLKVDFCDRGATLHTRTVDELEDLDFDEEELREEGLQPSAGALESDLSELASTLKSSRYQLKETVIEAGTEVTVFGTFQKSNRTLDVGSGLSKLSHGIFLGPAGKVVGRNVIKSLIATLLFGAAAGYGQYRLLLAVGYL